MTDVVLSNQIIQLFTHTHRHQTHTHASDTHTHQTQQDAIGGHLNPSKNGLSCKTDSPQPGNNAHNNKCTTMHTHTFMHTSTHCNHVNTTSFTSKHFLFLTPTHTVLPVHQSLSSLPHHVISETDSSNS